jgi:hypothetical protein
MSDMTDKAKPPRRYAMALDALTGKRRNTITFKALGGMMPESTDRLPGPVEFRGMVGRGKKLAMVRLRKRWVGFGWVDEGKADGTEPLLCLDDTVGGAWTHPLTACPGIGHSGRPTPSMSHANHPRLRHAITAYTKRGALVCLPAGTRIRHPFRAAGATHFLGSPDGTNWTPYYTTEPFETDPGSKAPGP